MSESFKRRIYTRTLRSTKIQKGTIEFVAYQNAPTDLAGRVRTISSKNWTGGHMDGSLLYPDMNGALSLSSTKTGLKTTLHMNEIKSHPNIGGAQTPSRCKRL